MTTFWGMEFMSWDESPVFRAVIAVAGLGRMEWADTTIAIDHGPADRHDAPTPTSQSSSRPLRPSSTLASSKTRDETR